MAKFTQAVKNRWLKSLRSGKFKQCKSRLCKISSNPDTGKKQIGYCCLGVLASQEGLLRYQKVRGDFSFLTVDGESDTDTLFYGLPKDVQETLAEMNDDNGMDFNKIADYIEQYVPAVK